MSDTITSETFKAAWSEIFTELYNGPSNPNWSWVVTNGPDTSILGTLKHVSAEQASQRVASDQTIAMHTEHLRWSLDFALAFYRGENPKPDWEESWKVDSVDAAAWDKLRADLKAASDSLREAVQAQEDWSNELFFKGTFAAVPHAAYHLGALRQIIAAVGVEH